MNASGFITQEEGTMPMKKAHLALVAAFMLAAPFMTTVRAQTAKPVMIGVDVDAGTLDPRARARHHRVPCGQPHL